MIKSVSGYFRDTELRSASLPLSTSCSLTCHPLQGSFLEITLAVEEGGRIFLVPPVWLFWAMLEVILLEGFCVVWPEIQL